MARVVALVPDLLFGSRILADLTTAGHEVELVGDVDALAGPLEGADVLVVDLTDESLGGAEFVEGLGGVAAGDPEGEGGRRQEQSGGSQSARSQSGRSQSGRSPRTLGFYSHVEVDTRERASKAGFDLIVPRSRMAREGAALVGRLRRFA